MVAAWGITLIMKMDYTHQRLLVDDVEACFRFYRDVLGLGVQIPPGGGPYAELKTGRTVIALFDRKLMAQSLSEPSGVGRGSDRAALCFDVGDVDATHKALAGKGVVFVAPPTDRPAWMIRTAHFRDPDGNLIEINAPLG